MKDYLVRGMTMDGFVKVVAIRSTELVRRGAEIQGTTPNATAAFGRCLTAASMMGNMQKVENGSMTLQVRGGGPIGTITVVSDPVGNVRGCMTEPKVPLVEKYPGKLDVGATVGTDGTLTVIRDLQMKEPYIGSTELVSGEIGDDVTAYFAQSEQTPTACALGVLIDTDHTCRAAGGILIQLLPFADEQTVDLLERNAADLAHLSSMIDKGMDNKAIMDVALRDIPYDIFDELEVDYKCNCSKAKMDAVMASLGRKQVMDLLAEQVAEGKPEELEIVCRFCNTRYRYSKEELAGVDYAKE